MRSGHDALALSLLNAWTHHDPCSYRLRRGQWFAARDLRTEAEEDWRWLLVNCPRDLQPEPHLDRLAEQSPMLETAAQLLSDSVRSCPGGGQGDGGPTL